MKKTFTLLFFVGILSSAFAQSRHGNQNHDNKYQSPGYSRDNNYGNSKSYPGNNGYNKNYQENNRHNGRDYSYNGRDNWDRNDMRRNHPGYGNQRGREDSYRTHRRGPWFKIIFSSRHRH